MCHSWDLREGFTYFLSIGNAILGMRLFTNITLRLQIVLVKIFVQEAWTLNRKPWILFGSLRVRLECACSMYINWNSSQQLDWGNIEKPQWKSILDSGYANPSLGLELNFFFFHCQPIIFWSIWSRNDIYKYHRIYKAFQLSSLGLPKQLASPDLLQTVRDDGVSASHTSCSWLLSSWSWSPDATKG